MNPQDHDIPEDEDPYPCVGLCNPDPETGYCEGCGRPPLGSDCATSTPVLFDADSADGTDRADKA